MKKIIQFLKSFSKTNNIYSKHLSEMVYEYDIKKQKYKNYSDNFSQLNPNFKNIDQIIDEILEIKLMNDNNDENLQIRTYSELLASRHLNNENIYQIDFSVTINGSEQIYREINKLEKGKIIGVIQNITEFYQEKESLHQEILSAQKIDPLTNLITKEYFFEHVEKEISRMERSYSESSLILFEINSNIASLNKDINENIIAQISPIINNSIRKIDILSYLQDNEFALILPETSNSEAKYLLDRLKMIIENIDVNLGSDLDKHNLRLDYGIASINGGEEHAPIDIYKIANNNMAKSKNFFI